MTPRVRPKRSLGQNFLVDSNLQRKIVELFAPGPDDEVLEVGPGRGALTAHLAGRVGRLTLVELDDALAAELERVYGDRPEITVLHRDILELRIPDVSADPSRLRVLGNIPYNITTPILFHLLERPRPADIVIMVQREVADRLVAQPGTGEYGALAVGVRTVALVERVVKVPRSAFRPVPRVDSSVVRIVPRSPPLIEPGEEGPLRGLTRAVFQWRRKQLQKTLRDHPDLGLTRDELARIVEVTGFDLTDRPERLSPEDFITLSRALAEVRAELGLR